MKLWRSEQDLKMLYKPKKDCGTLQIVYGKDVEILRQTIIITQKDSYLNQSMFLQNYLCSPINQPTTKLHGNLWIDD